MLEKVTQSQLTYMLFFGNTPFKELRKRFFITYKMYEKAKHDAEVLIKMFIANKF